MKGVYRIGNSEVTLSEVDIQIGAVEIKDKDSDQRAGVNANCELLVKDTDTFDLLTAGINVFVSDKDGNGITSTVHVDSFESKRCLDVNICGSDGTIPVEIIGDTSDSSVGPQKLLISQMADTVGDGTGVTDATGDYSGGEEIFFIKPPVGKIFRISQLIMELADNGSLAQDKYGSNITLGTGIVVRIQDNSTTLLDLTHEPIVANGDWVLRGGNKVSESFSSGMSGLLVSWDFSAYGQQIRLNGDAGERLEVVLNDDFTGLLKHKFFIRGYIEQ